MAILVTGGVGFIGSHTCVELLSAGYEVVVVDNLSNSSREALQRVEKLTQKKAPLHEIDLLDAAGLERVFASAKIDAVVHFAGLKAVGESVEQPLRYFQNNVTGTLNLLDCMTRHSVKRLVFSSSATVYGDPAHVPVTEDMPLSATNPYGRSKLIIEDICRDLVRSDASWNIALLRYFNPVGAHVSGELGEDPRGIPNNLMPYLLQVATGRLPFLRLFGDDYPTPDGSGVRDYIHVVDLALGHVKAIERLEQLKGCVPINLGTGKGVSVREMVNAFSKASGKPIKVEVHPRRPGDVGTTYADPSGAKKLLGWTATRGLDAMCSDAWRWQSRNPNGYRNGTVTTP